MRGGGLPNFLAQLYKLSKLGGGGGGGGGLTWEKSKRAAAFVRETFPERVSMNFAIVLPDFALFSMLSN